MPTDGANSFNEERIQEIDEAGILKAVGQMKHYSHNSGGEESEQ
jgi:hypothetical protein